MYLDDEYLGNEYLEATDMAINPQLGDLLTDLVFHCGRTGEILYANATAQRRLGVSLEGKNFLDLMPLDDTNKGRRFLESVYHDSAIVSSDQEAHPWELILGTDDDYTIASCYGYPEDDEHMVIVGHIQPKEVSVIQQEMSDLTSELVEAQRETKRQNQALQQALFNQRQLVRTIMRLSAPNMPIWDGMLLLSLTATEGHRDEEQLPLKVEQIWKRAGEHHARYLIIDMSNAPDLNKTQATMMVKIARILQHLGVEPLLADASKKLRKASKAFRIDLHGVHVSSDVHQAVSYVGKQLSEQEQKS